jgi:hypothetical protein
MAVRIDHGSRLVPVIATATLRVFRRT